MDVITIGHRITTICYFFCPLKGVCKVEGLRTVDKCYPCPVGNGDYSTKTGLLLKDTYQPLLSSLENCIQSLNSAGKCFELIFRITSHIVSESIKRWLK